MGRLIKIKSLEIPEKDAITKLVETIKPVLKQIMELKRSKEQIEIDDKIIEKTHEIITTVRNIGLQVNVEEVKIGPLWNKVVISSHRRCSVPISFEIGGSTHQSKIDIIATINKDIAEIGARIKCTTEFDILMSPDRRVILMNSDDISSEYGVELTVYDTGVPIISVCEQISDDEEEIIEKDGGYVAFSFAIKCQSLEEIRSAIGKIRTISNKLAAANLFETGLATKKYIDIEGNDIGESEQISKIKLIEDGYISA